MALDAKTIKLLKGSFPKEALQVYTKYTDAETGNDVSLVGFKPAYIIERLNEALGHDGWSYRVLEHWVSDKEDKHRTAWVLGELTVFNTSDRTILTVKNQFGHCNINRALPIGDALKGAATNALEKAASLMDIGHEAYKGLLEAPKKELTNDEKFSIAIKELSAECKKYEINKENFVALTKNVLGKEVTSDNIKTLTIEEVGKLTVHVKTKKSPF